MARRVEEALPLRRDPQVIWSGNEALQLPKISGRQGFDRRPCRRSDFTEIEIPAVLPQYAATNDLHTPQTNSSYQLFPAKNPSPIPPPSSNAMSQYQEQTSQPRDKYQGKSIVQDSILPEKNLRNLYMNHSAIIREKARRDQHQLLPERTKPIRAAKVPSAFPYVPTHFAHCQASVPWKVDQQPPGPTGDNSLTALQIAKSLSEVDFFPTEQRGPSIPNQRPSYRNGPSMHGDRGYTWEKEVGHCSLFKKTRLLVLCNKFCLLCLITGVCPPRRTGDRAGASQCSGSSEIHPGTQPQRLGWSGLLQVKWLWITCSTSRTKVGSLLHFIDRHRECDYCL